MADAANTAKYETKRLSTHKKLKDKGFKASFGTSKTVNHRGTAYEEKCEEYYFPIDATKVFNDVESGEYGLIVANFNNGVLSDCDKLGDKSRLIKEKKPFPVGSPVIIYYELLIKGNPL